jgi:TRAP transporter TAXI family solute receptor
MPSPTSERPAARQRRLNELLGARVSEISMRQWRELVLIVGPVLLLVGAAIFTALQFVEPAPPKRVVIATGGQAGGYFAFGQRYAQSLARHGITLEVRPTAGSIENIRLLTTPASGVSMALVQGGITDSKATPGLVSLGRLFVEPLWVLYRDAGTLDRLHQLVGRRIAIGPEGSGTPHLATQLLAASEVKPETATLLPLSGMEAAEALAKGDIDAVFLALAPQAPAVQALLRNGDVKLMSFAQAGALARRFPYLESITLPAGAIDLVRNIPSTDTTMVAPVAALVARADLHPALAGLLVDAASEVHSGGGLFHRIGDFPKALDPEFEMSEDAARYYRAGPSFLKRHLPFWLATFVERMSLVAVPLAGALIPLFKAGPAIYKWRVRRRLLYWYGRLKAVEASIAEGGNAPEDRQAYLDEVARIEEAVGDVPVPIGFSDQYYSLRSAIDLVRQRLESRSLGNGTATPSASVA